ncbi:glyoxalase [Roseivirga seohaensis]|uniref:Glyoxalase n=2 Tax=Roseivirga seohaensis TaxID=1914963 RepID=A0A150XMA3_9BACT|nr:glyoxalase [Roseivirga seohaensis]|tara:strand:- start:594 stop:1055 length:462 start_codon:yes stop_codon:yes gene_type:complete
MKNTPLSLIVISAIILTACTYKNTLDPKRKNMKSFISIFEIPTTDFSRAVNFYQSILDIEISEIEMQGTQMGLFPSDGQAASGVLIKGEGYTPSSDGVIIYLNGGDDLQFILNKVEGNGGEIIVPKTLIDEENGHFAMFLDTEGNRIGLHSLN